MTTQLASSLSYRALKDAIGAASQARDSARTDKLGAFLDELHARGFCIEPCDPLPKPQAGLDLEPSA